MKRLKWLAVMVLVTGGSSAFAGIDKVYSPGVDKGEWEFEARGTVVEDDDHSDDGKQKSKVGLGYGLTDNLFLEGYFVFEKSKDEDYELAAYELEAKIQLSEPGEFVFDYGLLTEVEKEDGKDIWEIKGGPLVQKKIDRLTLRLNVLAETKFGSDVSNDGDVEYEARTQAKYKVSGNLAPAVEYYVDEDNQALGPVLTGEFHVGDDKLEWQAGVLFGMNSDTADTTYRWLIEFEF